jgi:hypothetical protein
MNAKLILFGGLVFYAVTWILSFVTGPVVHNGLLMDSYLATAAIAMSYSGFFNLPDRIWFWWSVESLAGLVIGCAVLAWVADRWAPARP